MIDWIILVVSLGSIFVFMTIFYFLMIGFKNNGLVDIAWSLNFILAALVGFIYTIIKHRTIYLTQIVITGLVIIWGIRLSTHIGKRNIGKKEDKRYRERREEWGDAFYIKTFFMVNMLQALWAAIIVSPIAVANSVYPQSGSSDFLIINGTVAELLPIILGFVIWVVGFYFEVVGDWQLSQFIKNRDNKGKIIESGLWKYTRHPNYFGEITMSWGLFIIVISLAINNPYMWITIIGPILYTLLIRYVTGVPEVEKHLIEKPGYKEYMERTSVLFPLPSKKKEKEIKEE